MELEFADHAGLKKQGRNFNCDLCKEKVQQIRRCREERWDFNDQDGTQFPIRLGEGGGLYGFCPAKATWDHEATSLYRLLLLSAETGALLKTGGIADQPGWFMDLAAWFLPKYSELRFYSRAKAILGDGTSKGQNLQGVKPRGRHGANKRRSPG